MAGAAEDEAASVGSWQATAPPGTTRTKHTAVRLEDGRVLVAGGLTGETGEDSAEIYNPSQEDPKTGEKGTWNAIEPMNHQRFGHSMVRLSDGRVMVVGGTPGFGRTPPPPEVYASGEGWTELPPSPLATKVTATRLDGPVCDQSGAPDWCGNVLVTGVGTNTDGLTGGSAVGPAAAVYDPSVGPRGVWEVTDAPAELYRTAVRMNGHECAVDSPPDWCGGVLASANGSAQFYDPEAGTWQDAGALNHPRNYHTLTALRDGRVLAVGGLDSNDEPVLTAEIYNPSDGGWTETASLAEPRFSSDSIHPDHATTLLADGTVLVTGGKGGDPGTYTSGGRASAELFNPTRDDGDPATAQGAFLSAGSMNDKRNTHTATLLADGRVLVAGGEGCCGGNTADLYTPDASSEPNITQVQPATGVAGERTEVTITGEHLSGVSSVTFGGENGGENDVDFQVKADDEITATAPAREQPGAVPVRVTTPSGGISESEAVFTYVTPAGVWTSAGALPSTPSDDVQAVTLGGGDVLAVYTDTAGNGKAVRYDPDGGRVHDVADPPVESDLLAPLDGGGALVVGDGPRNRDTGAAAVYEPAANDWQQTQGPPVFGPSSSGTATATLLGDGRVLVVGVTRSGIRSQLYDPENDTWRLSADHPDRPNTFGMRAVRLADGQALLSGGGGGELRWTDRANVFDPENEQWTRAADMSTRRSKHGAVRLADDRVLVAGGAGLPGGIVRTDDIFDPAGDSGQQGTVEDPEGAWVPTQGGSLSHSREWHTLTRLADGSVLAVGGRNRASETQALEALAHVEFFRPDSEAWQPTASLGTARFNHASVYLDTGCDTRCGGVLAVGGEERPSIELYTPHPQVTQVTPGSGVPGTEVTISGYGFAGADEVTIGGESTEFTVAEAPGTPDSPAKITATVPPGLSADEAPVTVTNDVPTGDGPETLTSQASDQAVFTVVEPDTGGETDVPPGEGDGGDDQTDAGEGVDVPPGGGAGDGDGEVAPGLVDDLAGEALSAHEIKLTWTAVGDGAGASAPGYVVKQSREPIASEADLADAFALCGGVCEPNPVPEVGGDLSLTVLDLEPGTTYHYAVRARSASGELGPVSDSVSATTLGGGPNSRGSGDGTEPAGSELIRSVCGEDTPRASFTDRETIPEAHRLSVDCAAAQGVVAGFADGSFRPALGLRRDQMASFIARALQAADVALPEPGEQRFADVAGDSAHAEAIHRLAAAGIVSGGPGELSADRYGPTRVIRRDQMASFLIRAGEYATDQQLTSGGGGGRFSDVPVGNVHAAQVDAAAALELAQGYPDGTYRPGQQVRRDQMATFVTRLLGSLNQGTLADSNQ